MTAFHQLLGAELDQLGPALRTLHGNPTSRWVGQADVTWNRRHWARAWLKIAGMPRPGRKLPLTVDITGNAERQTWTRHFAGRPFVSHWYLHRGILIEDFGCYQLTTRLQRHQRSLWLYSRTSHGLAVPLPPACAPLGYSREWPTADGFGFDVRVVLPGAGTLLRYRGQLRPNP